MPSQHTEEGIWPQWDPIGCQQGRRITLAEREGKIPSLMQIYQKHKDVFDERTLRLYLLKSIIWPGQPCTVRMCLRYVASKIEQRPMIRECIAKLCGDIMRRVRMRRRISNYEVE